MHTGISNFGTGWMPTKLPSRRKYVHQLGKVVLDGLESGVHEPGTDLWLVLKADDFDDDGDDDYDLVVVVMVTTATTMTMMVIDVVVQLNPLYFSLKYTVVRPRCLFNVYDCKASRQHSVVVIGTVHKGHVFKGHNNILLPAVKSWHSE